jgi:hypothetical protein
MKKKNGQIGFKKERKKNKKPFSIIFLAIKYVNELIKGTNSNLCLIYYFKLKQNLKKQT